LSNFTQTHHLALDSKGRLVIPATFRKEAAPEILLGDFYISPEKDGYLTVRPDPEWSDFISFVKRSKVTTAKKKSYLKYLNALSQKTKIDGQNRLVLSPQMRKALGIKKDEGRVELIVVGAGDYFEILKLEDFEGEDAMLEAASDLRDEMESLVDEFPQE
jgi:transcriptional regulator MraZ